MKDELLSWVKNVDTRLREYQLGRGFHATYRLTVLSSAVQRGECVIGRLKSRRPANQPRGTDGRTQSAWIDSGLGKRNDKVQIGGSARFHLLTICLKA